MKEGIYKHQKGGEYEFLYEGKLEKDESDVVIYKDSNNRVWVRPKQEFIERFKFIREFTWASKHTSRNLRLFKKWLGLPLNEREKKSFIKFMNENK